MSDKNEGEKIFESLFKTEFGNLLKETLGDCKHVRKLFLRVGKQMDYCMNKCDRSEKCLESLIEFGEKMHPTAKPKAGDRIIFGRDSPLMEAQVVEVSPSANACKISMMEGEKSNTVWLTKDEMGTVEVLGKQESITGASTETPIVPEEKSDEKNATL